MKNDKYVACIAYYALLCKCASCRRVKCCKIAPLYSVTRSVTHAYIVHIQLTMILQMSLLQEQIAILFFLNSSWTLYCQLGLLVIGNRENVGQNFGMIQNRKKTDVRFTSLNWVISSSLFLNPCRDKWQNPTITNSHYLLFSFFHRRFITCSTGACL